MNVLGAATDAAGAGQLAATYFIAGDVEISRQRRELHVGARSLEDYRLRNLAQPDVFVEIAVQTDRAGDVLDVYAVDVTGDLDVAGDLGGAQRALFQVDLHRSANLRQRNVTMLHRGLHVGLATVDGHIAALAGDINGHVRRDRDVH